MAPGSSSSLKIPKSQGMLGALARRASSRWKDPPEKSFDPSKIALLSSSATKDGMNALAIELLTKTLDKQMIENEIATFMKRGFDERFGGSWNCIVGRNFGSHLSCGEHVHLGIAKISIIVFRC